jgi:hypothetical protein
MVFVTQPTLENVMSRTLTSMIRPLAAAIVLLAATGAGAQTRPSAEPGALLRSGNWGGDVGSFGVPQALQSLPPQRWPADGWVRLDWEAHGLRASAVAAPAEGQPPFLRSIVAQVQAAAQGEPGRVGMLTEVLVDDPEPMYLRAPGSTLRQGFVPTHRFRNGTRMLRPLLDQRYELMWQGLPFAFTVQNGLRTAAGTPYGEGAVYTIEIGGQSHRYVLPGHGWDSTIQAIADLDADGKPDFVISLGGPNAGTEAVLLSSQAQPGDNAPTATLTAFGC